MRLKVDQIVAVVVSGLYSNVPKGTLGVVKSTMRNHWVTIRIHDSNVPPQDPGGLDWFFPQHHLSAMPDDFVLPSLTAPSSANSLRMMYAAEPEPDVFFGHLSSTRAQWLMIVEGLKRLRERMNDKYTVAQCNTMLDRVQKVLMETPPIKYETIGQCKQYTIDQLKEVGWTLDTLLAAGHIRAATVKMPSVERRFTEQEVREFFGAPPAVECRVNLECKADFGQEPANAFLEPEVPKSPTMAEVFNEWEYRFRVCPDEFANIAGETGATYGDNCEQYFRQIEAELKAARFK